MACVCQIVRKAVGVKSGKIAVPNLTPPEVMKHVITCAHRFLEYVRRVHRVPIILQGNINIVELSAISLIKEICRMELLHLPCVIEIGHREYMGKLVIDHRNLVYERYSTQKNEGLK